VILVDLHPAEHIGLKRRSRFRHSSQQYDEYASLNRLRPAYRLQPSSEPC
jgi:hypothetical protein